MQTLLEKQGIESRRENLSKNDYYHGDNTEYTVSHKDALGDKDKRGKGTGDGGHIHSIPGASSSKAIAYGIANDNNAGNKYDIEGAEDVTGFAGGRKFLKNISLYNEENPYGAHLIDTSANQQDTQIVLQ